MTPNTDVKDCPCVCHQKDMDKEEYQKMCWKCDGTGEITL